MLLVFQALLLNNNWLTSLKGGGSFKDLYALRVSDGNMLSELFGDILFETSRAKNNGREV